MARLFNVKKITTYCEFIHKSDKCRRRTTRKLHYSHSITPIIQNNRHINMAL